jgi:hypothetical protein
MYLLSVAQIMPNIFGWLVRRRQAPETKDESLALHLRILKYKTNVEVSSLGPHGPADD